MSSAHCFNHSLLFLGHQDARAHHRPLPPLLGTEIVPERPRQTGLNKFLTYHLHYPHNFSPVVFCALGSKPICLWSVSKI